MHTHIAKWGASCAIRIPKMAVEMLGLHAGQSVNLVIENDKLVLQKESPRYKLSELVAQMQPKNEPDLIWDDAPQGDEIL